MSTADPLEPYPKRYQVFGLLACRAFITVLATFSGSSGLSVLFGIAQYQRIADEVKNLKALLS